MFNRRGKSDYVRIDCVTEQKVMGKIYKRVNFWRGNTRYCTLCRSDANLCAVGESMSYKELQKYKASIDKVVTIRT